MDHEGEHVIERELSFSKITVRVIPMGDDFLITLSGGERPHIGGCVMAVPRPSLTGEGTSCTSSVLNVCGHKDEGLLRLLAEKKCKAAGSAVVCTGGFHHDRITEEQIGEVQEAVAGIAELI